MEPGKPIAQPNPGAQAPLAQARRGGASDGDPEVMTRMTARVDGRVQGVGFRWWTRCRALELGLVGSATNLPDGAVEVIAQGPRAACEELHRQLAVQPAPPIPPGAPRSYYRRPGKVVTVTVRWTSLTGDPGEELIGFVER